MNICQIPLGITPPLSNLEPNEIDLLVNEALNTYLLLQGEEIYETEAGEVRRNNTIRKLEGIVKNWVNQVGNALEEEEVGGEVEIVGGGGAKKNNTTNNKEYGAQLTIFGSQRLGVHNASADIDVLCIAPEFITRELFFEKFVDLLRHRTDTSLVFAIPDAYTPVVKFNFKNTPIDMLFVSLPVKGISRSIDTLDISYLKRLDEKGVRSINGPRVAEYILKLVPNEQNFRTTLKVPIIS